MWNSRSIQKNIIYAKTPTSQIKKSVTPGSLSKIIHVPMLLLLRSNDPRVTIDPPALVTSDNTDFAQNAQFSYVSSKSLLMFLFTETRKEFSESNGSELVTRHVYLLITDGAFSLVSTEPSWVQELLSA